MDFNLKITSEPVFTIKNGSCWVNSETGEVFIRKNNKWKFLFIHPFWVK